MAGINKMIDQILEEANNSAGVKLDEARAEADQILAAAKEAAAKETEAIAEKSKLDVANYQDRMKSSTDLKRRTTILKAKQELISGILEKAYQKFCSQGDAAYFDTLLKMLEKFALNQEGILYLSDADQKKLPADFVEKAEAVAAKKGGTLTVSKESRAIEKGFVLAYGGIEENCSFQALFDSKRDELQDKIQAILFS